MPVVSSLSGAVLVVLGWPKYGTLLHALDLETGAQRWNVSSGGTMGSPLLVMTVGMKEIVVVGSYAGNVSAFRVDTGALVWSVSTGGPVLASPVTSNYSDQTAPIW